MNKTSILLFLSLVPTIAWGQGPFETMSISFKGIKYEIMSLKIEPAEIARFDILENDRFVAHSKFLDSMLVVNPQVFLVNASISDSLCQPIGYYAKNHNVIKPTNFNSGTGNFYLKPNGAILFMDNDVVICESSNISRYPGVRVGTQSGPMLITEGKIHPAFKQASTNKHNRVGVGIRSDSKGDKFLFFAASKEPVTFYDFAKLFQDRFGCDNALCLESLGCAMYFPNQVAPASFDGLICNYIFFKIYE